MAWNATDVIGVNFTTVDTTPVFPLGLKVTGRNTTDGYTGEFVYMKGVASTAAGNWALLNYDDGSTTRLVDGGIGPAGIAMAATVASTYGWYQVRGKASGLLKAGVTDNAGLYAQAASSAGHAGATGSGLSEIIGARAAAASGSSAANTEVEINYPVLGKSAG